MLHPLRRFGHAAFWLAGAVCAPALAGSVAGNFEVHIQLVVPASPASGLGQVPAASGFCTSESLSRASEALVTVVCSTGQFVNIRQFAGRPYAGTHGGAHRHVFSSTGRIGPSSAAGIDPYSGVGTVTSLRVLDIGTEEGLLEFLVSF